MYITNKPQIASIAQDAGVDRIFVDLEFLGKESRQKGMDTVKNHHTLDDVSSLRSVVTHAELLVRVNPIHEKMDELISSSEEINSVINYGADIVMLPYFKTVKEVQQFLQIVNGRAKTILLLETPEAVECINEVLQLKGIDEIHIGLNDLSIGYGKSFMFELFIDGTIEKICASCNLYGIPFGIGGIASLGSGTLPSNYIIMEHYRLGSRMAILSRSFCNTDQLTDLEEIALVFNDGVHRIREYEEYCQLNLELWEENHQLLVKKIDEIVEQFKK